MKSDIQLNIRAKESQRALIDAAAEILHKSRTDFILEMACQAAENVILDRRVFNLSDEQYAEFIDMLDAPVEANPALDKLLAKNHNGKNKRACTAIFTPSDRGILLWRNGSRSMAETARIEKPGTGRRENLCGLQGREPSGGGVLFVSNRQR